MSPDKQRDLEHVWDLLGHGERLAIDAPGVEEAWADLQRRTAQERTTRHFRDRPPMRRQARGLVGAALVILVVLAALGVWMWQRPMVITVPPGAVATIQLPDGSAVELNSDSEFRYQRRFQAWPFIEAETRRVTLRGEAFFEVAPTERPFIVETADAWVEVLGTQFNVRARGTTTDQETTVILASGRVRVRPHGGAAGDAVLSEPGTSARVVRAAGQGSHIVTRVVPLDPALAWRRRAFSAIDRPLASILEEVERHFAVDLLVEGPLALSDSMTVFYGPRASPEDILHDLCLVQGCRFRPTSRGFAIIAQPEAAPGSDA